MKKKFKVGDRLRGTRNYKFNIANKDMTLGKVIDVDYGSDLDVRIEILEHKKKYPVGMKLWTRSCYFDPVKPETIVIYRKVNEVIALDKSTGEKAVAKCNPSDTFDFKTGAKLAFERLLNGEEKSESGFKVGDEVRIKNAGSMYTTNESWVQRNVTDKSLLMRWSYGNDPWYKDKEDQSKAFVIKVIDGDKAFIEELSFEKIFHGRCFLIGIDGLEKL